VWSFHVLPGHVLPGGEGRCRLVSRSRTERPTQAGIRIATRLGEPVTLLMTRRMLRGLKHRAESAPGPVLRR
jgi:hypothetical protein